MEDDHARHIVRVYVGSLSQEYEALSVEASKHTTAEEIVQCIVQKLNFSNPNDYELAEVIGNSTGQECKERRIGPYESPVALKLLWPKASDTADSLLFSAGSSGVPAESATPPTTAAPALQRTAATAQQTASSSSHYSSFSMSSSSSSSVTNHFPNPAGAATAAAGSRNASSSWSYANNTQHQQNGGGSSHSHHHHYASNNKQSHTTHSYQQQHNTSSSFSSSSDVTSLITDQYRFCLRERLTDSLFWSESSFVMDPQIIRDYFYRFLYQPKDKEYPDLCQLPDLNELTLSENLKSRFNAGHIYTYVGSILIAINPFRFHPIYNPKYVKLYQNRRREELPPHIFAIADSAYHTMLKEKRNQCIVISGESGSGKTESTNFLLHHLTALSQKGSHGSGVEQTILSAGPVLEAFGNAKTAHNNNSSRFGKFIQVSYRENGMVHGAIVQKYLLEKSRICCQAKNERNYHVFYYLLAGASDVERGILNLLPPHKYHYLNQSECYTLDGVDESYEFSRLKQSMEMVGFGPDTQRKLFCVLSAVLLIGNVEFTPKKSSYHHDESVLIQNPAVVRQISHLLRVTEDTLLAALTSKRARVSGEMLVINYRMPEAIAARDAMAKCLYETLFDWIVLQVNHSLLSKKDSSADYNGNSIGVLDIFGFEDFGDCNSFEQFCINYANEHLQHYFNQHVFKYEQEEYKKEGIHWTNIDFMDNTPCLSLIEGKPNGFICILDDQCSFPGATNETLLQKFNSVHKDHDFYQIPQRREAAFIIRHYAGKVKYQVSEFREKNMDLMRHDIVSVLKNSSSAFVRELVGLDPVAVFRWAILRAFFRAYFSFYEAGYRHRKAKVRNSLSRAYSSPARRRSSNDHLIKISFQGHGNVITDTSISFSPSSAATGVITHTTANSPPSRCKRTEQIIRCHLIKSRNRSSLRPYPTANTPINCNSLFGAGAAGIIENSGGGKIYFNEPNLVTTANASTSSPVVSPFYHYFSPQPSSTSPTKTSIQPLLSVSSSSSPSEEEKEKPKQNENFYGSHHFCNECVLSSLHDDDYACAISPALPLHHGSHYYHCNDHRSTYYSSSVGGVSCLNDAFTANIFSPSSSFIAEAAATTAILSSGSFCSNSSNNCEGEENECLLCFHCGCSSPAVSHSHLVGYHADNPFVDGDGLKTITMMMEKAEEGRQENGALHHHHHQPSEKDGHHNPNGCYFDGSICSWNSDNKLDSEDDIFRQLARWKNRSFRMQPMMSRGMKNLQSVKILASQTAVMGVSSKNVNPRKQPLSVSQQFQQSLHSLMITLNQANPFFIRCIKSNSAKTPSKFDDDIVQRQLRYTGMLETVRIRQAGYNVRLTFDEFIQLYRILLPKGLESNRHDVHSFLVSLNLNSLNYQLGASKIFLREIEKIKLDYFLHQQIMASIVKIQRWYRALLERRQFLRMHDAVIKIQSYMRMYLAQKLVGNVRMRHLAATFIQKMWRGYSVRKWYEQAKSSVIHFQAKVRGILVRRQYQKMLDEHRRLSKQKEKLQVALRVKTDGDTNSGQSDEAFLSKGSSQEELDENKHKNSLEFEDSEESSGVHEDSEPETAVQLSHFVQSLSNVNGPAGTSSSASNTAAVSTGNICGTSGGVSTSPGGPNSSKVFQQTPSLSESMPALTLALSATPFSIALAESSSISQPLSRSLSPLNPPDHASQTEPPVVKERLKKKISLKSRKEKGIGKVVEDEAAVMREVDTYRDDADAHRREDGSSKNPFHRAKKHIKTFITGAGTSKAKLEKYEAVILDSGSEAEDNVEGSTTLNTASNSSSTQSTVTLSESYVEPASLESLIFDQQKMRTTTSPSAQKLRRESSGASSDQGVGAGDFMSMPSSYEHVPFGSRLDDFSSMMRHHAQKENVPMSSKSRRKGSDSLEQSRKSSVSSNEHPQPMSLSHNTHKTARETRSYYGVGGRTPEEIENVRRWATSTSSYDGLLPSSAGGTDREPSVRESVRNLIGMFADLNTKQPPHLPLKMYNSSSAQQQTSHTTTESSGGSPTNPDGPSSPNKASRTTSIPAVSGSREIRRTRSVSETRQPVHNRREFSLEPSPYVSADFVSADAHPSVTEDILASHGHHHHHHHSGSSAPKGKHGYHLLEKVTKFYRGEQCVACGKNMHVLFAPGVKCSSCKGTYHSKCVQNGMIQRVPCRNNRQLVVFSSMNDENLTTPSSASDKSSSTRRKPKPRKQKTDGDVNMGKSGKFSLTGTSEFTDRTDQIISGVKELRQMQEFISNKIYQVSRLKISGAKESRVDRVFEQALREFKESLVSHYSVASKRGDTMPLNIRYKDLIANFTNIMETASKNESMTTDSATTMGVNAFRGFLNEFMNQTRTSSGGEEKPSKAPKQRKERRPKEKGGKRQKVDDAIDHLGHSFVPMVINIPTACEICSSFIMWPIERGVVCQKCKLASHKKCHLKIFSECNEHGQGGGGPNSSAVTGIFGAPLTNLVGDGATIPLVVDQLITSIELYGLRMEGLYRKSGVSSRQKELKQDIEDGKEIDCELYPVHVLTSVLKSFFREMPEPLLTFEMYDEFLRASELSQQEDRINTLFALLKKLPKPNYDLMERLVFHLVRVALCEDKNRMNANSLAIVFAPCILRTNKTRQVQESLHDISRQTLCLETIILEQMKKVKETLSNIESVDTAAHSFSVRLNSIRSSKMITKTSPDRKKSVGSTGSLSEISGDIKLIHESTTPDSMSAEEEEEYLTQHIQQLQDEKAMLTSVLPSLSRTPSDEDMLSTDPEVDSPGGSVDDLHHGNVSPSPRQVRAQSLQYSKSESLVTESLHNAGIAPGRGAGGTGGSTLLHNLMKNRGPTRKPPSRFVRNLGSVDFGEKEGRTLYHRHHHYSSANTAVVSSTYTAGGNNGIASAADNEQSRQFHEEDESVISVDQNNDEEAILV